MTTVEKYLEDFWAMVNGEIDVPDHEHELTGDELRKLHGKVTRFTPDNANFLGMYFEPYANVQVFEKNGEYFHVFDYIGD